MVIKKVIKCVLYPFNFFFFLLIRLAAPFCDVIRKSGKHSWVIGGHRGRIYEDNSAALHAYVVGSTSQPIIWIAMSEELAESLKSRGYSVFIKDSLRARIAIICAPVLIYSHGEDDLDTYFKYFRGCTGLRVYLSHCLTHLKTGRFFQPCVANWSQKQVETYAKKITDFDVLLTSSPAEKANLDKVFRFRTDRILPYGGGAHIDNMLVARDVVIENIIVWFPTFRDSKEGKITSAKVISDVISSVDLQSYLERENFIFMVVGHINTKEHLIKAVDHPRISIHDSSKLLPLLGKAACLVTDYSGLTLDWLCFNRPIIHFAFDEKEYFKSRKLLNGLEDIQFGPLVYIQDEFIKTLITNSWQDTLQYAVNRQRWMNIVFPNITYGFSQRCYETIRNLRCSFDEKTRKFITVTR